MLRQFKFLFISFRPKQWIKNLFIFAALIFSANLLNPSLFLKTLQTFLLFCALTSSIYLINDLADLKQDKIHPEKKKRPLPSGKLKPSLAIAAAILLALSSISLSFLLGSNLGLLFVIYFLLFLLYSFILKKVAILDIFIIAIGFVLRVIAGALAISVFLSHWILICTFFLALFLGFSKRRHELVVLGDNHSLHRASLSDYGLDFIDQMISVTTASVVISYALYTVSPETIEHFGTDKMFYTIPFVLYGIFRYLYLVYKRKEGGSPTEALLTDKALAADVFLWVLAVLVILYFIPLSN
jgi:4-hydroxybenzoate polyprenyltransferase